MPTAPMLPKMETQSAATGRTIMGMGRTSRAQLRSTGNTLPSPSHREGPAFGHHSYANYDGQHDPDEEAEDFWIVLACGLARAGQETVF